MEEREDDEDYDSDDPDYEDYDSDDPDDLPGFHPGQCQPQ